MSENVNEAILEKALRDLESTTLNVLMNPFKQLVYLSSLREFVSDQYIHWGMENVYGKQAAQAAMRVTHQRVFRKVAQLPLPELEGYVREFLEERPGKGDILLKNWQRDESYNLLMPAEIGELEVESFRINFQLVLKVISRRRE